LGTEQQLDIADHIDSGGAHSGDNWMRLRKSVWNPRAQNERRQIVQLARIKIDDRQAFGGRRVSHGLAIVPAQDGAPAGK
jgi:hypothetical protein